MTLILLLTILDDIKQAVVNETDDTFSFSIKTENGKSDEIFSDKSNFFNQERDKKPFLMLEGDGTDEDQVDMKFVVTEDAASKGHWTQKGAKVSEVKSE